MPLLQDANMTKTHMVTGGEPPSEDNNSAWKGAADLLYLAAAPTFASMALLTCVNGAGSADVLCSIAGTSPLGEMVPMYLLMSAFHAAPWLKLISSRAADAQ
jgi:hypothetical protein